MSRSLDRWLSQSRLVWKAVGSVTSFSVVGEGTVARLNVPLAGGDRRPIHDDGIIRLGIVVVVDTIAGLDGCDDIHLGVFAGLAKRLCGSRSLC
jgi:hypothetical protein